MGSLANFVFKKTDYFFIANTSVIINARSHKIKLDKLLSLTRPINFSSQFAISRVLS